MRGERSGRGRANRALVWEHGGLVENEVEHAEAVENFFGLKGFAGDPDEERIHKGKVIGKGANVGELVHVIGSSGLNGFVEIVFSVPVGLDP